MPDSQNSDNNALKNDETMQCGPYKKLAIVGQLPLGPSADSKVGLERTLYVTFLSNPFLVHCVLTKICFCQR